MTTTSQGLARRALRDTARYWPPPTAVPATGPLTAVEVPASAAAPRGATLRRERTLRPPPPPGAAPPEVQRGPGSASPDGPGAFASPRSPPPAPTTHRPRPARAAAWPVCGVVWLRSGRR